MEAKLKDCVMEFKIAAHVTLAGSSSIEVIMQRWLGNKLLQFTTRFELVNVELIKEYSQKIIV